jgi:hypothetical protein
MTSLVPSYLKLLYGYCELKDEIIIINPQDELYNFIKNEEKKV